jgi:hypothetical protein
MKRLALLILTVILITGCGSFGMNTGIFSIEKIGDNGAIGFSDNDVKINADGSLDVDTTNIFILETQLETEGTKEIFAEYYYMWSEFYREMADVYRGIGK